MNTPDLIERLVSETRPVRPLPHPLGRTLLWLGLGLGLIALLGLYHGPRPDLAKQLDRPDFAVGLTAAMLTGALAAFGALMASLPDRSRAWLALPLPTLAVWLSCIGWGCLTNWVVFDPAGMHWGETARCFATVLLVSLPLTAGMMLLLRHAARLAPAPLMLAAGLAVAALTSVAMSLLHALDATLMILMWNLGVAMLLVAADALLGTRLLRRLARHG